MCIRDRGRNTQSYQEIVYYLDMYIIILHRRFSSNPYMVHITYPSGKAAKKRDTVAQPHDVFTLVAVTSSGKHWTFQ